MTRDYGYMKIKTLTGREIDSPSIRTVTQRKCVIDCIKADEWLRNEAIEEAIIKNDRFCLNHFKHSNPKELTQADKDGMHLYLFGKCSEIFKLKG